MAEKEYPQIANCVNYEHIEETHGHDKPPLFEEHLDEALLRKGLKEGAYFEGPLLVSRVNKEKGLVRVRVLDREVQVNGH